MFCHVGGSSQDKIFNSAVLRVPNLSVEHTVVAWKQQRVGAAAGLMEVP